MIKIKDILVSNEAFKMIVRVEKIIVSTGSNGSNYMIVHFVDKSGRIEGRKWQITNEDKEAIKLNDFIFIKDAIATEYRNVVQVKFTKYEIIDQTKLEEYGMSMNDFFISAPVNIEREWNNLMEILDQVENDTYRLITIGLLTKFEKDFKEYPAAMSIHHNVTGGLFWHSYTLVKNALAIKANYGYASIDWELLICGAILHDVGKIIEIIDVSAVDYSLQGKLLGHISIGNAEIAKLAKELNLDYNEDGQLSQDLTLLQHMVLASHGKNEYGSPIEPIIIEAVILSTLDNLDGRIYKTNDEISKVEVNTWTPRIMSEDNKFFYRHKK